MRKLILLLGLVLSVSCEKNDLERDDLVKPNYEYINSLHVAGDVLWVVSSRPKNYYSSIAVIPPYYISKISLVDDTILFCMETPAITSLVLDRSNQPYLGTFDRKILKLNSDLSIEYLFSIPRINFIREMIYDKNNNLWIATNNGGLYFYDGNDTLRFSTSNSILTSNSIPSIALDSESNIWFLQGMDLFKIDKNKTVSKDSYQLPIDKPTGVFNLSSDNHNTLFASKWDGNYHRLLKKELNSPWTLINPPKSSTNRPVKFIKSDSNGTIWICYSDYPKDILAYFDNEKWVDIEIPLVEVNILDFATYNNKIILGTSKGLYTMIKK